MDITPWALDVQPPLHQPFTPAPSDAALLCSYNKQCMDHAYSHLEDILMAAVTPLQSLVACGTKLWLDSIDPKEVATNREWGATGATSNPIIVSDLIKTRRFDDLIGQYLGEGLDDETLAWKVTDHLVR